MRRGVYVAAVAALFVGASIGVTPPGSVGWAVNPSRATLGQSDAAIRLPSPASSTRSRSTRDNVDGSTVADDDGCPRAGTWSQAESPLGAAPLSAKAVLTTVHVPVLMYHHVLPPFLLKSN